MFLRKPKFIVPIILACILMLGAVGCTAAAPNQATEAPAPAGTGVIPPTVGATPASTGVVPPTGGSTVQVSEVDFSIEMPTTIPAGLVTFEVTNNGSSPHSLEVEGGGIEVSLPQTLQPGESGSFQVNLTPGTYEVYCPIGDHRERGMEIELTVQ